MKIYLFLFLTCLLFTNVSSQTRKNDNQSALVEAQLQRKIDSLINLGNSYFMNSDNESLLKSIECYDEVLKLNPNCARAYFNKGNSNILLGFNYEACRNFKKAKELGHPTANEYIHKFCN